MYNIKYMLKWILQVHEGTASTGLLYSGQV
jgi:hypothetical protein